MLPAYHPAPIRTLPSGERVMVPSLLNDLAVLDGDSHWVVTGATPQWMAPVEAVADRFAAFEVELTASVTPAAQRACVYYASTDRPMHVNPPVCVDWLADGQPHVVRVPLRGQPGWAREVSHLRLEPVRRRPPASPARLRCGRGTRAWCRASSAERRHQVPVVERQPHLADTPPWR